MGKRSVKKDKNVYQISREEAGLTREKASEEMIFMSDDRIEKIESEKSAPHPDEILAMAQCYKKPVLANYYCSHECPIGHRYVPEIESKPLSQIVLEMLAYLHSLEEEKNRLISISLDGKINDFEKADFLVIREKLRKVSVSISSLELWVEEQISKGLLE